MDNRFERTELLIGREGVERLAAAKVAVFGVGGVGGYTVEALARSGIGALDLVDKDTVDITNINRQIIATSSSVGMPKVEVAKARIADINPDCVVNAYELFYLPDTADNFDFTEYDYIIDAVDNVTAKLEIISRATDCGTPVISSMGAGNKLDPTAFKVADIYETSICPLARVIRKECRKRGIPKLKVVYSEEEPVTPIAPESTTDPAAGASAQPADGPDVPVRRSVPGSVAFVPSVAGLIIAGEVIKDLTNAK